MSTLSLDRSPVHPLQVYVDGSPRMKWSRGNLQIQSSVVIESHSDPHHFETQIDFDDQVGSFARFLASESIEIRNTFQCAAKLRSIFEDPGSLNIQGGQSYNSKEIQIPPIESDPRPSRKFKC